MKQLTDHKLLIDGNCPMCRIYGNAFEKFGYVEKNTCLPYQEASNYLGESIDARKARNEIALINTQNNQVLYGVDALSKIIGNRWSIVSYLLKKPLFDTSVRYLYKFISQNRKVIAPSKSSDDNCRPDVELKYRMIYVTLVAIISAIAVYRFTGVINQGMNWDSSFYRELSICFGQIVWQLFFFGRILKEKKWEYIGNMSTVSLIGSLLLIPGFWLGAIGRTVWFLLTVSIMILEHYRRCKILNINVLVTLSWVTYRLVVLGLIVFLNQ